MAKKPVVKETPVNVEEDFDFDFADDYDDEDYAGFDRDQAAADVMQSMLAAARFEAETALALTKMYVENIPPVNLTKEVLFATYKEALTVAADSSPIKKMMEIMQGE